MKIRNILSLSLLLWVVCPLSAQHFLSKSEVGFSVGGMNYIGDLNGQSVFGRPQWAFGILGRYNAGDRWAFGIAANRGHLVGGDPDIDRRRNLSFRSYLFEANARVEFNFVPFAPSGNGFRTTPYLFIGVGFFCFNPTAAYLNPRTNETEWVELQPLRTEGQGSAAYPERLPYTLFQLAMPFGLGFKAALSNNVTFAFEYGFRKTWTDYIDDVSTTYVGEHVLGPGTLAAALADRSAEVETGYVNAAGVRRGDDSLNDWYAYFNLSLSFSMDFLFGWMRPKKCDIK